MPLLLPASLFLLAMAFAAAAAAVQRPGDGSGRQGDQPNIPIGEVPTTGNWSSASNPSGLKADLGSTGGGQVRPGGTTGICVHVSDPNGQHLSGASVVFSADRGAFSKTEGTTDSGGLTCTEFTAPGQAGQARITARIGSAGYDPLTVSNSVEIVGAAAASSPGADPALLAVAVLFGLAGIGTLGIMLWRRRTEGREERSGASGKGGRKRAKHWKERRRRHRGRGRR